MKGLPPETTSRACGVLLLLLALAAGAGGGGAPRPPRPCHHGTALTTLIDGSHINAASAAAATPAAAATLASQGAGAASTHPHREKHRGVVSSKGADAYMAEERTADEASVTYFLSTGHRRDHVYWRNATTAAAAGWRWSQRSELIECPCLDSLHYSLLGGLLGGVSGGRSRLALRARPAVRPGGRVPTAAQRPHSVALCPKD